MPFIETAYKNILDYFYKDRTNSNIPNKLKGIWNLQTINNMSILMTLENGLYYPDKHRIIVKLYEPGNWLFKEENFFTKFFCKFIGYSYQFDFDKDYNKADIHIKLGCLSIYLSKCIMDWTLTVKNDKMVRYTSMFGRAHLYESKKFIKEDIYLLHDMKYDKLYYC